MTIEQLHQLRLDMLYSKRKHGRYTGTPFSDKTFHIKAIE